jgi:multiple sugar transport system ATP-binding protein
MGDRIVILDKGKIQQADTPLNVYNNPKNKFVAGFIGSPQMNFIDSKIINGTLIMSEPVIELPMKILDKLGDRKEVTVGIRPELMINPEGRIKFFVKTEMTELLGSEQIVYFNINEDKCCAKLSTDYLVEDKIELSLDVNNFLYFDKQTGERIA